MKSDNGIQALKVTDRSGCAASQMRCSKISAAASKNKLKVTSGGKGSFGKKKLKCSNQKNKGGCSTNVGKIVSV